MADTDRVEWRLLDTDLVTQKCILPVSEGHIYFEFQEPGSGEIKIPLDSSAALLVSSGMFVMAYYRGAARGGFFVDNIKKIPAANGEGESRWMSISGRGSLALLDDCIVYPVDGSTDTSREFTATTKGAILNTLIQEGFDRGWGDAFDWDFTGSVDSNSVAWTDNEDVNVSVGQSLLDLLRDFASTGEIEFSMEYVLYLGNYYWRLHAYSTSIGTDLSESVFMRIGSNCMEVSEDERGDEIKNAYLVKFRDGYTVSTDATSITARRRREKLLNLELAQSGASAQTFASAKLSQTKDPKTSFSVRVYDGNEPYFFVDYNLGDTITVDRFGSEVSYRVLGAQVDFRGDEYGNIVLDLNSLHYENDLKIDRDLNWLMGQWSTARDLEQQEVRQWLSIGEPNGEVFALHAYGDYLYVGGTFTAISGRVAVNNVAAYQFSTGLWTSVGSITDAVLRIMDVGGTLYAATESKVYTYSGGTWNNIGTISSFSSGIRAMISDGSNLYIGGGFNASAVIGGATIKAEVAKYNGSAWSSVGTAVVTPDVHSLAYYNGTIYAGRNSAVSTSAFQYFNGTAWVDKFTVTSRVSALAVAGDELYLHYADAGAGTVSVWDGSAASLTTAGTMNATTEGTPAGIPAMAAYLSDIYFGAEYTIVNGTSAYNNIGRYSGGMWSQLGTGFSTAQPGGSNDDKINALSVSSNGDVYAGGKFTTADGKTINNLAVYIVDFQSLINHLSNDNQFDMAAAIHAATASAITDSDEMGFWEDVSNALRKITWANIKATLKTYFDTLYPPNDGWIPISATWTRTGNHTFTVSGDVTAAYRKGTKVKYKDGGSYEYGVILSSSYGAPNTTITLFTNTDYEMAAATITDTYISYIENPEGFPASFNYTATWNNFTANNATLYAKFEVHGTRVIQKAGFIFGSTPSVITGTLNLVPIATPLALGTTQEYFGATTIRDTGTALFEGTVYLIGGNLYPQVSATSGSYAAPSNVTSTVPMTWVSTDEISMICEYTF